MSTDAILTLTLDIDKTSIDDFKSIEEHEVEYGKVVEYMNKTGYAGKTPRFGFTLEYVVPKTGAFNFSSLRYKDAVVTLTYDGGSTTVYRGVRLLKRGAKKLDGDNAVVIPYEFFATAMDPEV